jgi:hypothetical protein
MKKPGLVSVFLIACVCTLVQYARPAQAEAGIITNIVLYVPNRVCDLVDIFRVRVRVGPGLSAGVRVTKPVSAYLGLHDSVYVGLPGPRGEKTIPWPVGIDQRAGAQTSLADASVGEPYYDPLEVGFEVQPLLVGVNIGIGFFEILDFITGFVFIDLQGDDFGKRYTQQGSADDSKDQGANPASDQT